MGRIKTNPNHKATFNVGVECHCSCGWRSGMWMNKGARRNATQEWWAHREQCERADAILAAEGRPLSSANATRTLDDVVSDKTWSF